MDSKTGKFCYWPYSFNSFLLEKGFRQKKIKKEVQNLRKSISFTEITFTECPSMRFFEQVFFARQNKKI
jgi:hypothetical protein